MASVIITPADGYPIDVEAVRQQCRIDTEDEDGYITDVLIPAVCAMFEELTGCRLLSTVMEDRLPGWPRSGRIDLAWGKVQGVTGVTYLDAEGAWQTLDPSLYQVNADALPGEVHRSSACLAPAIKCGPTSLRVRYTAGLAAEPAGLPPNARLWLLLHVGHFYANREASASELKPLLYANGLISAWQRTSI